MRFFSSEYEKEKAQHKKELVRNEFKVVGKYNMPLIKKQDIDVDKIEPISFVDTKNDDEQNKHKTVHFFTHDWLFEKVYTKADDSFERLKQYHALFSPDFSLFIDMPLALQIHSVFKNRWCGAYWQSRGAKVIPTVAWGDERSFEFCFDGIEEGSIVAVCTYYREHDKGPFMYGYNKMMEVIKPSAIICYDEPFDEMKGNIKYILPTAYEWTKNLNWQEKAKFEYDKQNRNVIFYDPD